LGVLVLIMASTGGLTWALAMRWPGFRLAPTIEPETVATEVERHSGLATLARSRLDATTITGLLLTSAAAVALGGATGVGVLLFMVRRNIGFARFDGAAARFGAHHATHLSTAVLRDLSQFGGARTLVPIAVVVAIVFGRQRLGPSVGFLVLCVGGQFAVANTIKYLVDRARPDIAQLTHFSGSSFPSGHAVAASASFAAFALLAGRGRSARVKSALAATAIAVATGIAASRVLLGVHWFSDVLAGLSLGWAWFALCSIAFGGRLLRFGAPAIQAEHAAESQAA
jgi:undecaprenyl-diphosphatase